jgi:uncharacterized radical SAM superfamily protein
MENVNVSPNGNDYEKTKLSSTSISSISPKDNLPETANSEEMTKLLELNKRYVKKFCNSTSKLNYERLSSRFEVLLELANVNMIHWENTINQYKKLEKSIDQRESLIDELERLYERLNEEEKANKALKKKIKDQDKTIFDLQQKSPDTLVIQIKLIMEQLNSNLDTKHNEIIQSIESLRQQLDIDLDLDLDSNSNPN